MPETTSHATAADEASPAPPLFMASVDLAVLSPVQRGFVQSIRALDVEARDIPLSGAQLKAAVADEFPPGVLFGADLGALPLALRELRRWLDSHGAALGTHPSHRVPPLLAASLYTDAEDTVAAKEIVRVQLAAGRRANATAATDDSPSASGHNGGSSHMGGTNPPDRLAHNVAMRFKDKAAKFSGGLGEAWMEYVADYQQVSRDYNLTSSQKLQFLHNLLAGDAKRFYLENVQAFATSFNQAVELVSTEYNSVVRQSRVKNYLSTFRMSTLVAQGKTETFALEQTYKNIMKLAPMVPRSHQGDAHRVDFLRHAVVGYPWANEPLSRVPTHNLSFQQLYGELEAALQLHGEAKQAIAKDNPADGAPGSTEVATVLYAGQGVYGRPNKGIGAKSAGGTSRAGQRKEGFDPLTLMGCFNCDDPGHTMRDCPHPRDVTRAAKRKLDYFAKKRAGTPALASVLYHLCTQVDEEHAADAADAAAETGAGAASVTLLDDNAAVESRLYDAMLVAATTRGESSAGPSTESMEEVSFVPGV